MDLQLKGKTALVTGASQGLGKAISVGLAKVVAKDGVTVNCLQPGKLRSEQIDKRMPTEEARREWAKKEVPMERVGEPEELADLAVFLASPRAGYISGNVIVVDGAARFFAFED